MFDDSSLKLVSISGGIVGVVELRNSAVANAILSLMLVSMVSFVDERVDWIVELIEISSWNISNVSDVSFSFLISYSKSFTFSSLISSFTSNSFDSSLISNNSQQLDLSSFSFSLMEKGGIRGVGMRDGGSEITYNYISKCGSLYISCTFFLCCIFYSCFGH